MQLAITIDCTVASSSFLKKDSPAQQRMTVDYTSVCHPNGSFVVVAVHQKCIIANKIRHETTVAIQLSSSACFDDEQQQGFSKSLQIIQHRRWCQQAADKAEKTPDHRSTQGSRCRSRGQKDTAAAPATTPVLYPPTG
ncbi:hypothetical protein TNCV_2687781 [Trichonephila clavipes]|nr:hypothetical protein TNCV_2687781 [Trichonephila clavipes]